jgi:hypothetical protein
MDNITAQPIEGDLSLLGRSICNGYPVTSWNATANCVDYNCGLSGDHSPGQACDDGVQRAYTECTGAWVTKCLPPSDNDGNPDDGSGGGGGGSGNDDAIAIIPLDECIAGINEVDDNGNCFTIDEEEESRKRECRKITDFLSDPTNQAFKDKLIELSLSVNLNLDKEKSVSIFENQTQLDERIGTANNASVAIQSNPINKYKAFVHTHPNIPPGTSSVFTPADLIEIARIIENDKLTDSFVAFLTTKKGTQYAITIQNPTKFANFFYSQLFDNVSDAIALDPINAFTIRERYYNSYDSFQPLFDEYFDPKNNNAKIKITDTDKENVLKEFLNFMDEADAGFTLFETDINASTFKKLKLKNGEPERQTPCN